MPLQFTPPPRRVPLSLTIVNLCNGLAQIGWAVFGFTMIFFWAFVGNADLSFITFRGEIGTTSGVVTGTAETGASEDDQAVSANHYEYSVAGVRYKGTSYTTGGSAAPGEEVTVQYKEGKPERSRILGMRRAHFGPFVLFVTIFPLVGFFVLYFGIRSGIRRAHLLRTGMFTTGKLVDKEPTNMTVNDRRVYELTFEFTSRDGRRCAASASTSDSSRLEDDSQEPLLYDPDNPSNAYLLDEVPGRPELDGTGELVGRPIAALLAMILPALVIAGHGYVVYLKYIK